MSHVPFWLRATLASAALTVTTAPALATPERACDCRDNDRDGLIDEGIDCLYRGSVEATADDAVDLYVDGAHIGGNVSWDYSETYTFDVPAGEHIIAVEARDTHMSWQGFRARVEPPLGVPFFTGDGIWRLTSTQPPAGWQLSGVGNFTPDDTLHCPVNNPWGNTPQTLAGADWVWDGGCRPQFDPRENYGVAEFSVCREATVCCDLKEGSYAQMPAAECAEQGTQTSASACVEVCCDLGDSVETLTYGECKEIGGRPTEEQLCEEVCCETREGYSTVDTFTCGQLRGDIAEDRFCEEACDCEDNDDDGAIDERIDCTYDAALRITADDSYTAWLDGAPLGSNSAWSTATDYSFAVTAGTHIIAVEAWDVGYSVQGLLARVFAPHGTYDTGDGLWQLANIAPPAGWQQSGAGLPINDQNAICASANAWNGLPASLAGADWVWPESCSPYSAPRRMYAATTFDACVEATVCCQLDGGAQALPAAECEGAIVDAERCEEQPCDPIICEWGYIPRDTDGDGCDDRCVPDRLTPAEAQPAQLQMSR